MTFERICPGCLKPFIATRADKLSCSNVCKRRRQKSVRRKNGTLRIKVGDQVVTSGQYDEMFQKQNGRCGVCGRESEERLRIDHDHRTGKIRKLLCNGCNTGLGMFQDDPNLLEQAAAYIRKHS